METPNTIQIPWKTLYKVTNFISVYAIYHKYFFKTLWLQSVHHLVWYWQIKVLPRPQFKYSVKQSLYYP